MFLLSIRKVSKYDLELITVLLSRRLLREFRAKNLGRTSVDRLLKKINYTASERHRPSAISLHVGISENIELVEELISIFLDFKVVQGHRCWYVRKARQHCLL